MARVEIRVSDLTGEQMPDDAQAARLIVEHPDYAEPIGLDVLPDEITPHLTDEASGFVVLSLEDPENPNPQRYALSLDEFNQLFQRTDAQDALEQAYSQQQQEQKARRRGQRRTGTRQHEPQSRRRERIDYSSPEHAGEPHRGTISEAEAEYVRNNLEEVNARLRERGDREIDPSEPEMAARYRFEPPVGRDDVLRDDENPPV